MTTALAVIFNGPGQPLEQRWVDLPMLGSGEILVRISACTLCGSDLHSFDGRRKTAVPTILGHEIIGTIASFGPEAPHSDAAGAPLTLGDRITWALVASCGRCFYCRRGLSQKCERAVKYGHEPTTPGRELTGGLAEYCVLAPRTSIIRLPDHLDDAAACPANCATATVAAALTAVGPLRDRAIIIIGAGMLGLTACAMARVLGASDVICCEPNASRRLRSLQFGATQTASPEELADVVQQVTGRYGVDSVLELSGSTAAFEATLPLLRLGGAAALVGAVFPAPPMSLSMETIVRRNLRLIGIHNYAPGDLELAVGFLAGHPEHGFETLVDRWFPLADAEEAFEFARNSEAIRIGVRSNHLIHRMDAVEESPLPFNPRPAT